MNWLIEPGDHSSTDRTGNEDGVQMFDGVGGGKDLPGLSAVA